MHFHHVQILANRGKPSIYDVCNWMFQVCSMNIKRFVFIVFYLLIAESVSANIFYLRLRNGVLSVTLPSNVELTDAFSVENHNLILHENITFQFVTNDLGDVVEDNDNLLVIWLIDFFYECHNLEDFFSSFSEHGPEPGSPTQSEFFALVDQTNVSISYY